MIILLFITSYSQILLLFQSPFVSIMNCIFKNKFPFSLDFSKLHKNITTHGNCNYTIGSSNPISGYLVQPKRYTSNTVIMIHQWWGLNNSICQTANIFSSLGKHFRVFVPDLYKSKTAQNAQQAGHLMSGLNWNSALDDIKTIKNHFENGKKNVSILGFCMGGALTFASLSTIPNWRAGSPFYGVPDLNTFKLQNINCRTLAHFGELDPVKGFSCVQTANKLIQQISRKKLNIQIKIWKDVNHAFCNQNSSYFNEKVRNEAFKLTQQLFEKVQ